MPDDLFNARFLAVLEGLVTAHHALYPKIPPRDIFFESLVERAYRKSQYTGIVRTTPNSPQSDIWVDNRRISLKTESGKSTRLAHISITKLCTTEKEPWDGETLIAHVLAHLSRYEHILMLRAVWLNPILIHYQLLDIPVDLLRKIENLTVSRVGKREGRGSLAGDLFDEEGKICRIVFDGSDGKCQVHQLPVARCHMLLDWDQPLED